MQMKNKSPPSDNTKVISKSKVICEYSWDIRQCFFFKKFSCMRIKLLTMKQKRGSFILILSPLLASMQVSKAI